MQSAKPTNTSWESVGDWYGESVGDQGHFFHQELIFPWLKKNWLISAESKVLDLGCGQGVLGRTVCEQSEYVGVDVSAALIRQANQLNKLSKHHFLCQDVTQPLVSQKDNWLQKNSFSHAAMILCAQNMENLSGAIKNAAEYLTVGGKLVMVLNHPCFRIPRQSSSAIDAGSKLQYRRINRYLSPLAIPITAHPGSGSRSPMTWSFHQPISYYAQALSASGFVISSMDELVSPKISQGKAAKMENRSRNEFPLFLVILAEKRE